MGSILTHMVPDFAKWQIRVGGVLLFEASERPLIHPVADLDDPIVPEPEDGALWDGQILQFYVKLWNLTVPKGSSLRKWCSGAGQMQVLAPQGSETALWIPKPSHRSTVAAHPPHIRGGSRTWPSSSAVPGP